VRRRRKEGSMCEEEEARMSEQQNGMVRNEMLICSEG
jgi:hypothetical protein